MAWLGAEDAAGIVFVTSLLGDAHREFVKVWSCRATVAGGDDWISLVNEIAQNTPGTLAHRALGDARMPERFRLVAPDFDSLGWRVVDGAGAVAELAKALEGPLLGNTPARASESADAVATAFVSLFGASAQFLTNVTDDSRGSDGSRSTDSWATACPLTPAVAEAGVIAVGASKVGILWISES